MAPYARNQSGFIAFAEERRERKSVSEKEHERGQASIPGLFLQFCY
jgi:hypothetical protein